jgi:hypothetical protein
MGEMVVLVFPSPPSPPSELCTGGSGAAPIVTYPLLPSRLTIGAAPEPPVQSSDGGDGGDGKTSTEVDLDAEARSTSVLVFPSPPSPPSELCTGGSGAAPIVTYPPDGGDGGDGKTSTEVDLDAEDDRPPQNFWVDPPG